jgi:hypothetical protein
LNRGYFKKKFLSSLVHYFNTFLKNFWNLSLFFLMLLCCSHILGSFNQQAFYLCTMEGRKEGRELVLHCPGRTCQVW